MYFSFDFAWYYFHLDVVCKNRGLGDFSLNGKID